ncbi:MAG: group II intron reverse transcriptase/maturase [Planctomycetota bacterium]|jgi:group II intron reverse transcriptase/maturase
MWYVTLMADTIRLSVALAATTPPMSKDAHPQGKPWLILHPYLASRLYSKDCSMSEERQKVHSLTGRIDMSRMRRAFRVVKRNHGAPGVDRVTIEMFEANLEQNLAALMFDLKHRGQYHAAPLLRVYIPKGKGEWRALGIPTVRDRVAQEVVRSLLEPIFEPTFVDCSFGFRPGRNAHQAVASILDAHRFKGCKFVVDADIKAFFDNIPHELIIDLVAERVADGNILQLLREFLTAEVWEEDSLHPVERGTPQGGVISPLLANIVLDVLDQRLMQAGFRFVRYADDFVVLCPDAHSAEQALALVSEVILQLGLSLSLEKTRIATFQQSFDFLGFHFARRTLSIRTKSLEKFKERVRSLTTRSHNLDQQAILALNKVITGFAQYFVTSFSTVEEQCLLLDAWIRMRLRCMKFKRISKLDNWRLLNKHLARMGLVSLYDIVRTKHCAAGV